MRVYRIRKQVTGEGKLQTYHADVIAPTAYAALDAAKQGRVENWRWIIQSDAPADVGWIKYSYVTLVEDWDHRDPEEPRAA